MKKKHLGETLDSFLDKEGLLEEATDEAIKRILAFQIHKAMEKQSISKAEMAKRMETSRAALDRLLAPENDSVTLATLKKAARVIGKKIRLELV